MQRAVKRGWEWGKVAGAFVAAAAQHKRTDETLRVLAPCVDVKVRPCSECEAQRLRVVL